MMIGSFAFPLGFNVEAIGTGYFGYQGTGSTSEAITNIIHFTNFTLSRAATVSGITAKTYSLNGGTQEKFALYYQSNRTRIAYTAQGTATGTGTTGTWVTLNFATPVTIPAGNYQLAAWGGSAPAGDTPARLVSATDRQTTTVFSDGFEGDSSHWDDNWDYKPKTGWQRDTWRFHGGAVSAEGTTGYIYSDPVDTSVATVSIPLSFWYYLDATEADDFELYYYDGSTYDFIADLGGGVEDTWLQYTANITDSQYFKTNFSIAFRDHHDYSGEHINVDDVLISTYNDVPAIRNLMPWVAQSYGTFPSSYTPAGYHNLKGCIYANYTYVTAPAVTTNTSTNAEETTVTMNGFVTDDGGEDVTFDFQYGLTTGYGSDTSNVAVSTGEVVNINQGSLTPGKLYHYRSRAMNTNTTSYGSDKTFLTKPNEPTALTISNTGSLEQTIRWTHGTGYNRSVVRGTIGSYPSSPQTGTAIYNGTSDNVVRVGLTVGNVWYYRVWEYMTWNSTSMFSDTYDEGFLVVTTTTAPNVTTNDPAVGKTYAVLNGEITDDGGAFCKAQFQYGLTTGYGTNTTIESIPWGEDFDDDTVGSNPTSDWYAYNEGGGDYGVVSNTFSHSSPNSFKKTGGIGKTSDFLFNEGINPSSFSFWAYQTGGMQYWYANGSGGGMNNFLICDATSWAPQINFTHPGTIDLYAQINEWVKITLDFNWSTNKYRLSISNATSSSTSTWANIGYTDLRCLRVYQLVLGTNYFDDFSFPLSDGNFSFNATGLTDHATLYHYRAVATNTNGTNIGYGADKVFLTQPDEPGSFTATDINANTTQHLTWTHGTGYNRTVVRVGTTGFPADPQSGSSVYNGTGTGCYYSTVLPGQLYYYRAWEYATYGAYHQFSPWSRIGCLTKPASVTNVSIGSASTTSVNFTWDKGLGANRTVIVRKTGSYPTSRTDGTIVYNGTASYFNYTSIPADTYLSAWSWTNWTYNPTLSQFSLDPTIMPWKVIGVNVFNESKPSQALTFSIQIRNANGSEVLQYLNNTGFLFVDLTNFTSGSNVYMRAWATNYQARERTFPIFQNNYYNISFYLPRKVVDDGGDPEGGGNENTSELRGYIDSISVTSNLTDATIPLTHALDSMISVEIYKSGCTVRAHTDSKTITSYTANVWMTLSYSSVGISSVQVWNTTLYGTYGGLVFIPADKYTYYSANHTVKIDKSVLNSHALTITIAKVDYSYNDCSGGEFGIWVSVPSNKYTYTSTSVIINKTGYDNTTTMIRVNYYYLYYTGAITITVYYVRVVENINTEYSNYDLPVADATVIFKRYMNTTGAYEIISNLITDANGYVNIYLIPNVQYLIHVDKTGYDSTDSNYIPVPGNQLGQTIEKVLRIVKTAVTPGSINYEFMMKNITWDYSPKGLTIHGAFTFYFNITSSDSQLEWYSMQVLQFNYSSHLWENISYQIAFNAGGGTLSYNVPNVTGRYAFHCWFKKINYSAYELSQTGSFDKFLVYFEQWMADIPDYAYYIVLIVIMMIVSGFCFMYLGTGILTGYIALGIMAIGLFITDDVSIAIGSNTNISGWVIFAITFILYTVGLFLWSKL